MLNTALIDAGAIVAILNRSDRHHAEIFQLLKAYEGRLLTTWPVVAEACSLVREENQVRVLDWIGIAGAQIYSIDDGLAFMRQSMSDYEDLPCDFADASLLYAAWRTKVREIWTIDSDFMVYRLPDRSRFRVIPGGRS